MSRAYHRPYRGRPYGPSRGGFRGGFRANPNPRPSREVPEPLGQLLDSWHVSAPTLPECSLEEAKITDLKVVSSYNLMSKTSTKILVPGAPPLYTPLSQPRQLRDDSGGEYFREENAARFPKHAMEPAVKSLFACDPDFDTSDIDIFACASTIGSLLRLVTAKDHDFSLVVQIVGNTAFFLRREQSPAEIIKQVYGFGHAFPEAYTTWEADVKGSSSHQRVLSYKFGEHNCLLRFEGDGYLGDRKTGKGHMAEDSGAAPFEELLINLLSDSPVLAPTDSDVQKRGHIVDQSSVFDLKTRSIRKIDEDIVEEELPRLWVRQIACFVLAFHRSGTFEDIRVQDVRARVLEWEAQSAPLLQRLSGLINRICYLARRQPRRKIEVRGTDTGMVSFHAVDEKEWNALPPWLEEVWKDAILNRPDEAELLDLRSIHSSGRGRSPRGRDSVEEHDAQDVHYSSASEEGSVDYTACSEQSCGYCGHCPY